MKRLAPLLLAALACACATVPVDLRYMPKERSQVSAKRLPRIYVQPSDELEGGVTWPSFWHEAAQYDPKVIPRIGRSVEDGLQDALKAELAARGIPLASSAADADAVLSSRFRQAELVALDQFAVRVEFLAKVDLALRDKKGTLVWDRTVSGRAPGKSSGAGMPGPVANKTFNEALTQAMRKFGRYVEAENVSDLVFAGKKWDSETGAEELAAAAAAAAPPAAARVEAAFEPDIETLPAQGKRRKGHAVIVGVERYREGLPSADFASADARLVAEYAKRLLGYPEQNVAVLSDDRATRADFEKYFERWLPNRVEKDDEVFVYFSGHGAPNPKSGDAYLVPYDADPTYIEQTGYPLKRLYAQLAKLPAKRVVVAMDSCFSGAGGRSVIAKGARPLVNAATTEAPKGVVVLSAAAGDQISNSYREKGHGLFTYFLLKGLREKGSDLRAAYDYLKPEVARVARREYNADQEPQWIGPR